MVGNKYKLEFSALSDHGHSMAMSYSISNAGYEGTTGGFFIGESMAPIFSAIGGGLSGELMLGVLDGLVNNIHTSEIGSRSIEETLGTINDVICSLQTIQKQLQTKEKSGDANHS